MKKNQLLIAMLLLSAMSCTVVGGNITTGATKNPSVAPSPTPTASSEASATPTPVITPAPSATPSPVPLASSSPTAAPTPSPLVTPTPGTAKIFRFAGIGVAGFSGESNVTVSANDTISAKINSPSGLAIDASGNVYFSDSGNSRLRKVSDESKVVTVAGNGNTGYSGDNGPATSAGLQSPYGIHIDSAGNIFIADYLNHRIRKIISGTSTIITTVAGGGTLEYLESEGAQASLAKINLPVDVVTDRVGNIYIADISTSTVRKVSVATGLITTVAGTGSAGGAIGNGGPARSASLSSPFGIALDGGGNLYISDTYNNRICKVNSSGIITTVAGTGTTGFSGDGGPATSAQLNRPKGLKVDTDGNIYFCDSDNNRIRKISRNGIITTIAGNGTAGYSGDTGLALEAMLNKPFGIVIDKNKGLYVSDSSNHAIRFINN